MKESVLKPSAIALLVLLSACAAQPDREAERAPEPVVAVSLAASPTGAQAAVPAVAPLAAAANFDHCLVNWAAAMQSTLMPWTQTVRQCEARQNAN